MVKIFSKRKTCHKRLKKIKIFNDFISQQCQPISKYRILLSFLHFAQITDFVVLVWKNIKSNPIFRSKT